MENINKCSCGKGNASITKLAGGYFVSCKSCLKITPTFEYKYEAIDKWNKWNDTPEANLVVWDKTVGNTQGELTPSCGKCNKEIKDKDWVFCPYCGMKILW